MLRLAYGKGLRAGLSNFNCASLVIPLMMAVPAHGQIIEIDTQGEAVVYDGPTLANDDGFSPVTPYVGDESRPSLVVRDVNQIEREYGLPKGLVDAVIYQESRGRMNAVSPKGALGLMQLMPGTAAQLGVNPYDAEQNIRGGALYLRQQIDRFGSIALGLAAYNAGPGAVIRYRGIPPYRETQNYVAKILGRWQPPAQPSVSVPIPTALTGEVVNSDNAFFIEVTEP